MVKNFRFAKTRLWRAAFLRGSLKEAKKLYHFLALASKNSYLGNAQGAFPGLGLSTDIENVKVFVKLFSKSLWDWAKPKVLIFKYFLQIFPSNISFKYFLQIFRVNNSRGLHRVRVRLALGLRCVVDGRVGFPS